MDKLHFYSSQLMRKRRRSLVPAQLHQASLTEGHRACCKTWIFRDNL